MFSSPLTVVGAIIAALGWLWLLIGAGVDTGVGDFRVINLHMTALANNVIILGYVLAFAGILARGLERIADGKAITAGPRTAKSGSKSSSADEEEIAEQLRRKLMERGLRH